MLIALLALAGGNYPPVPTVNPPTGVSDATVATLNPGQCNTDGTVAIPASIRVAWTILNPNDTAYETKIYHGGTLWATVPSSVTNLDTTFGDAVVDGPYNQWTANGQFLINLVSVLDGSLVSATVTNEWNISYGSCSAQG